MRYYVYIIRLHTLCNQLIKQISSDIAPVWMRPGSHPCIYQYCFTHGMNEKVSIIELDVTTFENIFVGLYVARINSLKEHIRWTGWRHHIQYKYNFCIADKDPVSHIPLSHDVFYNLHLKDVSQIWRLVLNQDIIQLKGVTPKQAH